MAPSLPAGMVLAVMLAASGPVGASGRAEAYVSASAQSGDGSAAHPFSRLTEAVETGAAVVHVRAGAYKVTSLTLGPNQVLEAEPGASLELDGAGAALILRGGTVRALDLRCGPGAEGIRIQGAVRFEDVHVSSSCAEAVRVERGALTWNGGGVTSGPGTTTAIDAGERVTLALSHVRLNGPAQRGLTAQGASLRLIDVTVQDAALGIRVRGGTARLEQVRIEHGSDTGLFVGPGTLDARSLTVRDHDYGVLVGQGAEVQLNALTLERSRRAGLAANGARVRVSGGNISDSGEFGGVQLSGSDSTLSKLHIARSLGEGVAIVGGSAELRGVAIDGVSDPSGSEGDGVLVRRARARLEDVTVAHTSGLGLYAAQDASLGFGSVALQTCAGGAVASEAGSRVQGDRLHLTGGAQLIATRSGQIALKRLELSPPGALEVHCEADALVTLGELVGAARPGDACVRAGRVSRP